jgi:hypothetical protein
MKRVFVAAIAMVVLAAAAPLTAEQDHQRLLDLQGIKVLRPGVSGDPKAPNAYNMDEAKAGPSSPLPDPLKLQDGKPVTTSDMWWQQRRQELMDAYEYEVYGRASPFVPGVQWRVADTAKETVGKVAATTRHLIGHLQQGADSVDIALTISAPAKAKGPVPVVLLILPAKLPFKIVSTWREQVLAKGWAAAQIDPTSFQADSGEGLASGIIGLAAKGQPRGLTDWGVLRAWAWGVSRAMDYFETDTSLDSGRVAVAGHSRYGKAALVAMAYDPRIAVAYVSSSGAGGAAPFRRNYGERIENLAGGEYYWFDGAFLKYAGPKTADDLPVDTNELIALCAPRPVFIGVGANGDNWVDAHGMFLAEVAAGPVYRLLGKKDLGTDKMPAVGQGLTTGELAFRQHAEGHTMEPNWPVFLDYAGRYFKPKPKPKKKR